MKTKKSVRSTVELVLIVAAALFFALTIQALAVKPYRIPSGSMEPTLKPGQRIIVNRFSHRIGSDPKLGDITVFIPPHGADTSSCGNAGEGPFYNGGAETAPLLHQADDDTLDTTFVKRVVGLPGDTDRDRRTATCGATASRPASRSRASCSELGLQPELDHGPQGHVLPDGRQPRELRRQPLLGPGPAQVDHRQGRRHVLAARQRRRTLGIPLMR